MKKTLAVALALLLTMIPGIARVDAAETSTAEIGLGGDGQAPPPPPGGGRGGPGGQGGGPAFVGFAIASDAVSGTNPSADGESSTTQSAGDGFEVARLTLFPAGGRGGSKGGKKPDGTITLGEAKYYIVEAKKQGSDSTAATAESASEGTSTDSASAGDSASTGSGSTDAGSGQTGIASLTAKLSKTWYERPQIQQPGSESDASDPSLAGKPEIVGEIALKGVEKAGGGRVLTGTVSAPDLNATLYLLAPGAAGAAGRGEDPSSTEDGADSGSSGTTEGTDSTSGGQ